MSKEGLWLLMGTEKNSGLVVTQTLGKITRPAPWHEQCQWNQANTIPDTLPGARRNVA